MTDVPKTVEDWADRLKDSDISGSLTMVGDNKDGRQIRQVDVGPSEVGDYQTKIPGDLLPHLHELLRERDRMVAAALKATIEIPDEQLKANYFASLRASCLQIAIDVIRKKYEGSNGTTESNSEERSIAGSAAEAGTASTATGG